MIRSIIAPYTTKKIRTYQELNKTTKFLTSHFKSSIEVNPGRVLIDASWYNPNFWLRYGFFNQAAGLDKKQLIGLTDKFCKIENRIIFSRFNIENKYRYKNSEKNRPLFDQYARKIKTREDILKIEWPYEVPGDLFYDYVLKRQQLAFVNIDHSSFRRHLFDWLNYIEFSKRVFDETGPELIITSHPVSQYVPLVWHAVSAGVPVVIPFGDFGMNRLWKFTKREEIYDFMGQPDPNRYEKLSAPQKEFLINKGRNYLEQRFAGQTGDIGAEYAFKKNVTKLTREGIRNQFSFNSNPIIVIYNSNWFDFPHGLGMKNFTDFYDWITHTVDEIKKNKSVNWILRSHPIDEFYGGPTLKEIITEHIGDCSHVKLCPTDWSNATIMKEVDAIITYHGTIGLEATSIGTPVLNADVSWYHRWNFTKTCYSREEYTECLHTKWWESADKKNNADKALAFTGLWFGRPDWQKKLIIEDDSSQSALLPRMSNFLTNNATEVAKESALVREWHLSGEPHFHNFKMFKEAESVKGKI